MKKLTFLIIASMMASPTFALPIYKKYPTPQALASQEHPVELNDFSGKWVGSCTRGNEGETSQKIRLTITQNPNQIALMFNHQKKEVLVLNLNQLSSQTSNTFNKREAIIQRVHVLDSNSILFNYESIAQQGTSEENSSLITTSFHGMLTKDGTTLTLQETAYSSHGPCVLTKAD
ncbi:hypothetical protein ACD661_16630 [Legionella lytica]|uniref:Uncharacterized protein n=1 Tax=Legionella lytica TaxID=96232 RepID=A0ABW8DDV6_9GAMM